jgi:hypothetical protein
MMLFWASHSRKAERVDMMGGADERKEKSVSGTRLRSQSYKGLGNVVSCRLFGTLMEMEAQSVEFCRWLVRR